MTSVLREEKFLNTLVEITGLITAGLDRRMTFSKVLSCALEVLAAEAVFLVTLENGVVVKYAKRRARGDVEAPMERYERTGDRGIAWWVMMEGKAVLIPKVTDEFRPSTPGASVSGTGGCICAPLKARETVLGVLIAVNRLEASAFSEAELSVLSVLANQTAIAIESAKLYEQVQEQAVTDELTQVFNFRFMKDALHRELDRASRFRQYFSVLMLDVDHLKDYNDRFGHLKGSTVLKELGAILKATARSIDTVAKYGGDEFLIILPQTPKEGALVLAERIRSAVATHTFPEVSCGDISCSIGAATYPEDGKSIGALLESADTALFGAKRTGRNRVVGAGRRASGEDAAARTAGGSARDVSEELME
ncbi:MAG: sensor domain-containing diguanylate cyclase [Candidatus Eisenbacteria bacterium]|nr:sensor domain-containing diguanylate cyclase [Candidatus Eisenbacteria bacterium]